MKKGAKIQEVNSQNFISDEERIAMERRHKEELKMKEALAEKQPDWKLFCYMGDEDIN